MPVDMEPPQVNPITDAEMKVKLAYIDNLNDCINAQVGEIEQSDHPKAKEIAERLREDGFDNAAWARHCMVKVEWGSWDCPACDETHEDPEDRTVTSCGYCHITVLLSEIDEHGRRDAWEREG